ncbi:hypothetical protein ACPPVU_24875 [Mucilaginibacter sp. McL0603]|uniref:hypothetical protein n=1 Tax=Mucilaginibacter sp. McL0603 TaxID=3415670 RepID=UPI003CF66A18
MRYLLLSSCLIILAGCSSVYKNLQPATGNINYIQKFKPDFKNTLYKAEIDVVGHHLSGLLLIKTLPDSSIRMVFSNEIGFKFFDFEFRLNGGFKVLYVIKQMGKKPVIKTLKKDFELILLLERDTQNAYLRKDDNSMYYIFPKEKGSFCYITDLNGTEMKAMEISSPHKPIVLAIMKNYTSDIPDTIGITHTNFNFIIGLKKIER